MAVATFAGEKGRPAHGRSCVQVRILSRVSQSGPCHGFQTRYLALHARTPLLQKSARIRVVTRACKSLCVCRTAAAGLGFARNSGWAYPSNTSRQSQTVPPDLPAWCQQHSSLPVPTRQNQLTREPALTCDSGLTPTPEAAFNSRLRGTPFDRLFVAEGYPHVCTGASLSDRSKGAVDALSATSLSCETCHTLSRIQTLMHTDSLTHRVSRACMQTAVGHFTLWLSIKVVQDSTSVRQSMRDSAALAFIVTIDDMYALCHACACMRVSHNHTLGHSEVTNLATLRSPRAPSVYPSARCVVVMGTPAPCS